jgi:hypothetical protein
VLVVLSQGVSNFANDYMSYPTKLLFKASKLIVIMIVGRCVIGGQYHALEVTTPSVAQPRVCYTTVSRTLWFSACVEAENNSCCRLPSVWSCACTVQSMSVLPP